MADLTNSKRNRYTATYVTKKLTDQETQAVEQEPGDVLRKLHAVLALSLDERKLAELRRGFAQQQHTDPVGLREALAVVGDVVAGPQPSAQALAALAAVPARALRELTRLAGDLQLLPPGWSAPLAPERVLPVGWLFLERIETYPVGVERGEMVFTIPMAPQETITVSHREWSTSEQEYTDIVDDYFEGYSERGVVDKTDASLATENEAKHASSVNFGATLSGGYGPVTLTTTLGLTSSDEERSSVKQSVQSNRSVTEKASSRTRKDHKVSVKLESRRGADDSSFRTITNTSADPVRFDFALAHLGISGACRGRRDDAICPSCPLYDVCTAT